VVRRSIIVLSFTPAKVGDHYSLLYNSLSSRSIGLFFTRSVPEPSIYATFLFNTVPAYYPQSRSSPKFGEPHGQGLQNLYPYPTASTREQTFPATFSDYQLRHEGYSLQRSFPYPPSQSTASSVTGSRDSRKLPQADQWRQPSCLPQSNGFSGANSDRSPMASYPAAYPTNQTYSSAYHMQQSRNDLMNPQNHGPNSAFDDRHYSSPYGLSSRPSYVPYVPLPRTYSPSPVRPASSEGTTINKVHRCTDAAQLKVLNDSYSRTAFPSTEERIALATMLDMSISSVQIW